MTLVTRAGRDTSGVDELARGVVQRIAPDEMPQFVAVARSFHAASRSQVRRAARRNEPLGIGADGVTTMLTLAVLYVTSKLADSVLQRFADQTATTLIGRMRGWTRRVVRGGRPSGEGATAAEWIPGSEQLATIRAVADRKARRLGLTAEQAELVADGIVAELATRRGTAITADADGGTAAVRDDERG
ncbi:hypothetical protein [Streptomyces alanosinicus]|uniref:Uncharacterized protein n=1 Tax=Streptomyces alanosinicus TaxID=68171 RepID=A0A919D7L2_9ACTN|nr:hypothetical protein [Streptomyces alanosinicus]GHE11045.1 hypothetical protein GCM10010339_69280 [Streptomyces alanosinicus]